MKRWNSKCMSVCVLLLAASVASAADWTGGGSDPYWDIAGNWSNNAIPTESDSQNVVNVVAEDGTVLFPVVFSLEGVTDTCANLFIGTTVGGEQGDGALQMTDGRLTVVGNLYLGNQDGTAGLMNVEDGFIEVNGQFNVGQSGDGHLRMAGGHIIAHGTWLHVPNTGNSTGRIDLFGGTLETTQTFITRSVERSLVDLSGGRIVVPEPNAGNLAGYIGEGRIIAYGGRGTVVSEVVDGNTVLTGTADPDVMVKAWHQNPSEGATLFTLNPMLAWVAGEDANSHNVYLGTDPNALSMLTADPCEGALSVDFYTPVTGLAPGTTYYWRVDEVADDASVTTGDLWSFMTVPPRTSRPLSPEDGSATEEISNVALTWEPGEGAVNFNVFFAAADDELALVSEAQTESTYLVTGPLISGQTYRWRVDTYDGTDLFPGLEVSFQAGNPPAIAAWNDGDPNDSLWSTPGNWAQNAVPGMGTIARLRDPAVPIATIDANTVAYCSTLELGWDSGSLAEYAALKVTGGSLTIEGELLLTRFDGGVCGLYIEGGVVNTGFVRAWTGDVLIVQTGGEFNCAGEFEIPRDYASNPEAYGVFQLHGGICRAGTLNLNSNPNVVSQVDITEGTLILNGDVRGQVNGYIDAGLVTAFYDFEKGVPSETASISMAYDVETNKTTVIACEEQKQADFNADCLVDEKDRALLVAAMGDEKPAKVEWDFDMSTDPVGPDKMDLKVRNANNGNYHMDAGALEVTGGLLLDQQANAPGLFDTSFRVVAKAASQGATNALRLWATIGVASSPGSKAYLGFSLYMDGGTQTLELWTGQPPHIAPFEPVVITGLAADTFVDFTVNADFESETLDWTVTDGTLNQSGTDVPYDLTNAGDGGSFTFQAFGGSFASIDHFTYTIHGSNEYSPYDLNRDGIVDQADLDILEAEMSQ
ncbi:hypothetical protein ACFL6U_20115 [Planctomycetota bacterium]